jgi:hypothetical protein
MKNSKKNKAFVKPSGAKQNKFFIHVVVVKNINLAVVNKLATLNNTGKTRVFLLLKL